jgi:hypothetical protein
VRLFGAGLKNPTKDENIVYLPGAWDMFHAGIYLSKYLSMATSNSIYVSKDISIYWNKLKN